MDENRDDEPGIVLKVTEYEDPDGTIVTVTEFDDEAPMPENPSREEMMMALCEIGVRVTPAKRKAKPKRKQLWRP